MDYPTMIKIQEKVKTKKNGIYEYRSYTYAVKDNRLMAYADYYGDIYQYQFGFAVKVGTVERYEIRKTLSGFLKPIM